MYNDIYNKKDTLNIWYTYLVQAGRELLCKYPDRVDKDLVLKIIHGDISHLAFFMMKCNDSTMLSTIVREIYVDGDFIEPSSLGGVSEFFRRLSLRKDELVEVYSIVDSKQEKIYIYQNYLNKDNSFSDNNDGEWRKMMIREFGEKIFELN